MRTRCSLGKIPLSFYIVQGTSATERRNVANSKRQSTPRRRQTLYKWTTGFVVGFCLETEDLCSSRDREGAFPALLRDSTCSGRNVQSRNSPLVDLEVVQKL